MINKQRMVPADVSIHERYRTLLKEYVPKQGQAKTRLGEVLRAVNQIVMSEYRVGIGMGNEECNPAARYLMENAPLYIRSDVSDMWGWDSETYDDKVLELIEDVVRYAEKMAPAARQSKNDENFWDYADDDEEVCYA